MKIYQVDAFTSELFGGNPAAVCPLEKWIPDDIMQKIAAENNLAETAFYVNKGDEYEIRWFTPKVEVDLCGHATLAASYVLCNHDGCTSKTIRFVSPRSGVLTVSVENDLLVLNFPTDIYKPVTITKEYSDAFDKTPNLIFKGKTDYMYIFDSKNTIENIVPDMDAINKLDARGVIVTAKGDNTDFVSRFFAPRVGISEDPVTGSAHTTLIPFWSEALNKNKLTATQLSERKGFLFCKYLGDRVEIGGSCTLYMVGDINDEALE